jgi:hypothetical protein
MTDEEFREEYKPIEVPARFNIADTQQNKMIYALAQIGDGTAEDVIAKLEQLQPGFINDQTRAFVCATLAGLFEKGHLTGTERSGQTHYNLHKITAPNGGSTDPGL